jgi:hypothetical protein
MDIYKRLQEIQSTRHFFLDEEGLALDAQIKMIMRRNNRETIFISKTAKAFFTVEEFVAAGFSVDDLSFASILVKKKRSRESV